MNWKVISVLVLVLSVGSIGGLSLDLSGDGLAVYEDLQHGTNPLEVDTDEDGLTDYEEIHNYKTNPLSRDTDEDGLSDSKEIEVGTHPTIFDSSGDGLPDGYTYNESRLDVDRYNFIVEITAGEHTAVPDKKEQIREYLDGVPVYSRMGEKGINVVFIETEPVVEQPRFSSWEEYETTYYPENHTLDGYGVHHISVVDSLGEGRATGYTSSAIDGMVVEEQRTEKQTIDIMLHEMGHQMGLWSGYDGIDSKKYDWNEYPSVMNYNSPVVLEEYSLQYASTDYTIIQNQFITNQASIDELENEIAGEQLYTQDIVDLSE